MHELAELTDFSAEIGHDLNLVQAGGGNTSLKSGDVLWVKASGMWLARAAGQEVFVAAPLRDVLEAVEAPREYTSVCNTRSGTPLKPSVETTLHAVISHRVVVHVHSVNAIAWAAQENAPDELPSRLAGLRWAWVPYVHPGVELARAIRDIPRPEPDVVVLANHGLVIAANDFAGARALLSDVQQRLHRPARRAPSANLQKLESMAIPGFRVPDEDEVHAIGTDSYSSAIATRGILFPDQCVYLGAPAVIRDQDTAASIIEDFRAIWGPAPKYLIIPGAGILISGTLDRAGWEMLVAVKRVLEQLDPAAAIQMLDAVEVSRLLNWDAEKYRQALAMQYTLAPK